MAKFEVRHYKVPCCLKTRSKRSILCIRENYRKVKAYISDKNGIPIPLDLEGQTNVTGTAVSGTKESPGRYPDFSKS
jgi:hypothetical protein